MANVQTKLPGWSIYASIESIILNVRRKFATDCLSSVDKYLDTAT